MPNLPFPYSLWPIPEIEPKDPPVIVPLDYGVTIRHRNSAATLNGLYEAANLRRKRFPNATIVFGTSSHSFPGSDVDSTEQKKSDLASYGVPLSAYAYAGPIRNTVEEAKAVMWWIMEHHLVDREILIICDRLHSRSIPPIWRYMLPYARISLVYNPVDAWQTDHIFPAQRTIDAWFLANVKRQVALKIFGVEWVGEHGVHKTA